MKNTNFTAIVSFILMAPLFALLQTGCSGFSSDAAPSNEGGLGQVEPVLKCTADAARLESEMDALLTSAESEYDFTYQIERADGRQYTFNYKGSTPNTVRESASTSKMVTGMIIMRLVEKGVMKLSDHPQDYIADWPIPSNHPMASITLEHLLSFRSGLTDEPSCINQGGASFTACVKSIATTNMGNGKIPGAEFYYSGTHMQVAGLMAIRALGRQNWGEVFADFQASTGLFPNGRYDLPSAANPRLAGGMHWTGAEYLAFLRALKAGKLLAPATMSQYLIDRTASPVVIGKSPAVEGIGEDWHYGLGFWQECQSATYNCTPGTRISSPGAYGAYPFWDLKQGYIGMLSIQTSLGGFRYGTATLERLVTAKAAEWADCE